MALLSFDKATSPGEYPGLFNGKVNLLFGLVSLLNGISTFMDYLMPKRTCSRFLAALTSPGGNTPQDTNCTATCLLSRKLFQLDEPDMQVTAGETGTNS